MRMPSSSAAGAGRILHEFLASRGTHFPLLLFLRDGDAENCLQLMELSFSELTHSRSQHVP